MKHDCLPRPEQIDDTVYLAPHTVVLGDVWIGEESSVWFGSIIRGDTEVIRIGSQTNIQDLSVLHADPGFPCVLGNRVTVGHQATVHGATIDDEVMIGMRAVLLNGSRIGSGSVVAAGALVPEGMEIPPGSLVMGIPAKIRRPTDERDLERIHLAAAHYVQAARAYLKSDSMELKLKRDDHESNE